jgi:hypothetical protein
MPKTLKLSFKWFNNKTRTSISKFVRLLNLWSVSRCEY